GKKKPTVKEMENLQTLDADPLARSNQGNLPSEAMGAGQADTGLRISVLKIGNYLEGIRDSFNQGILDWTKDTINFVENEASNPIYWYNKGSQTVSDIANGRSWLFNSVSEKYALETVNNVSNMSANDWAYTAGYSAPSIALSAGGGYALGIVRMPTFKIPKFNHRFVKIKNGFVHKKPYFRVQYSSGEGINPIGGRRYSGQMDSGPHINIDFGSLRTHTFLNPRKWDALSTNRYLPFRYSIKK
ncbi:hypothetical protein, partial [Tenacibaculum maritimum]